jgi:hypothetical protein
MHYEIIGRPESPQVDCMQFHVSSSLAKAEAYVRAVGVNSYSWWQVHPYIVDRSVGLEEGDEVYFYRHRGTRLNAAPVNRAIAAFQRYVARHPDLYPRPAASGQ